MKKIVALALCLIMALSLATVAFGATTYKVGANEVVEKAASGYVTRYVDKTTGDVYVTVKSGTALEINGTTSEINVAVAAAENNYGKYTVTAKAVEAIAVADQKCCDVTNTSLYVAGGVYYEDFTYDPADTKMVWLNVDGAVVCAHTHTLVDTDVVEHAIAPVYGDDGKVTGFTCTKCDAPLAYTKVLSDALKAGVIYDTQIVAGTPYYVMYAAAGTTAAEGVTSAKTFDAGVALYAGMALMSVAGSAVVIGKKKEF